MTEKPNSAVFIRAQVFGCDTQAQFAEILGTTQASVSRWEKDGYIPGRHHRSVRERAIKLGKPWNDSFFYDVPASAKAAGKSATAA